MRFSLTTPLATISASFMTWYLMEQRLLPPDGVGSVATVLLPQSDSVPARVGCSRRPDEFQELYLAGSRVLVMLQDLATFVCSEAGRRVLPWPLETVQSRASELFEELRSKVNETQILEPILEAAEATRSFGLEVLEQLRPHLEVPRQRFESVSGSIEEVLQSFVESFLEKYPQHRQSLSGLHPAVLLLNLTFLLLALGQLLYGTLRLGSMLCCCFSRRQARSKKGKAPETSAASATSATSSTSATNATSATSATSTTSPSSKPSA